MPLANTYSYGADVIQVVQMARTTSLVDWLLALLYYKENKNLQLVLHAMLCISSMPSWRGENISMCITIDHQGVLPRGTDT